jgi:hypothetical protein
VVGAFASENNHIGDRGVKVQEVLAVKQFPYFYEVDGDSILEVALEFLEVIFGDQSD